MWCVHKLPQLDQRNTFWGYFCHHLHCPFGCQGARKHHLLGLLEDLRRRGGPMCPRHVLWTRHFTTGCDGCIRQTHRLIWMFPKMVGFPPKSTIVRGFSIIFTIHFGGFPPIFGKHPYGKYPIIYQVLHLPRGAKFLFHQLYVLRINFHTHDPDLKDTPQPSGKSENRRI